MKRVNMTQLARKAKSVVEMAQTEHVVVVTPGDSGDVMIVNEEWFINQKKIIKQLALIIDGRSNGLSDKDISASYQLWLKDNY